MEILGAIDSIDCVYWFSSTIIIPWEERVNKSINVVIGLEVDCTRDLCLKKNGYLVEVNFYGHNCSIVFR